MVRDLEAHCFIWLSCEEQVLPILFGRLDLITRDAALGGEVGNRVTREGTWRALGVQGGGGVLG